jgi:hypothetical protein
MIRILFWFSLFLFESYGCVRLAIHREANYAFYLFAASIICLIGLLSAIQDYHSGSKS